MIQRKQTVFLFLALVATVVCMCLPVGRFIPAGMGVGSEMFNLWIADKATGETQYTVWALFAILLVTCPVALAAIFGFNNRKQQARFCMFNILLYIGWYIVYVVFAMIMGGDAKFHPSFAACLPFVALVLTMLARKGINDDEKLVRAADRIR